MMETTLLSMGVTGKDDLITIEATHKLIKTMFLWSTAFMNKKCRTICSQYKV
ncbi:hypothetical protein HNQ55_003601 [Thalassotalea piscium]|uniref:Uncharacterized protein n=1 Tax=Thalassotalea piscium TaxID=1230533 RepID=A0A7X0NKE1_9GAMM|nr:hypothetical protein [Thalassotalea piscium]